MPPHTSRPKSLTEKSAGLFSWLQTMTNSIEAPSDQSGFLMSPEREAMLARYHALTAASNARLKTQAEQKTKTAELMAQVVDHEKAQQIRRMVRLVLKAVPKDDPDAIKRAKEWRQLALDAADDLDPVQKIARGFSEPGGTHG